jgi:hypothetical protein
VTPISQQQTIAFSQEDWTATVPFNQLDPSAGTLLDAAFTTSGSVVASASIENLAPVAATVSLGVAGTIVATAPVIGVVGSINPTAGAFVNLGAFQGAFNGTVDFTSPSGTVLPFFFGTDIATVAFHNAGTPAGAPFVGTGTFDVAVSSTATSSVAGNGNLAVLTHASAGAAVSLQYDVASPGSGGSPIGSGFTNFPGPLLPWIFTNSVTTAPQIVTLPSGASGWTVSASFNQFDPTLGTLEEIIVNVGNTITGTFSAENLESVAAPVNMTETATVKVTEPQQPSWFATSTASSSDTGGLGAFDGTMDFSGSSGRSDDIADNPLLDLPGSLYDTTNLAAFTGPGTIDLTVASLGSSLVTGPSNLYSEITQQTGGTVSVSYVYETANSALACFAQGTRIATPGGEGAG